MFILYCFNTEKSSRKDSKMWLDVSAISTETVDGKLFAFLLFADNTKTTLHCPYGFHIEPQVLRNDVIDSIIERKDALRKEEAELAKRMTDLSITEHELEQRQ